MNHESDHLGFSTNPAILSVINAGIYPLTLEKIYYSEKIEKINDFGIQQERNFVITDKSVYNFKKTSI